MHANMALQRQMFATGKPVIGDLFIGTVVKRPFVSVQVPVFRDGEIKYSLDMGIFPEQLNDILKSQRLPPNWIAVVFDTAGVIVARTHSPARFVGEKGAQPALDAISERGDGTIEVVSR
jgi:hypothetical protein